MGDPVVESMAEVRSHLADVIDRARREETPTIITRRGKQEAVVIDMRPLAAQGRLPGVTAACACRILASPEQP
jgi:prevent-host-death family protein